MSTLSLGGAMNELRIKAGLILIGLIVGCGIAITYENPSDEVKSFRKDVDQRLKIGIEEFESGNYDVSLSALQGVLESQAADKKDHVIAYKYLAFIHCISSNNQICNDYFRKALEIDPNFELSQAEIGHPVWGVVFRKVKGKLITSNQVSS